MNEEVEKEHPPQDKERSIFIPLVLLWMLISIGIGVYHWLETGEDLCPAAARPLMVYAEQHHLHYRASLRKQMNQDQAFWCADLWPIGAHWWSEDSYYVAGTPLHPLWHACGQDLNQAVNDVMQRQASAPNGDFEYYPVKTLIQCEK